MARRTLVLTLALTLALTLVGCSTKAATSPADGTTPPALASGLDGGGPQTPAASAATTATLSASAEPAPSAAPSFSAPAVASASSAPSGGAVDAVDAGDEPVPKVGVSNIGMHIGGGPNDDVTKDPIRRSVAPHFDEFRRCFPRAEDTAKQGDFGVDLRIDKAGGKAQVSHPRTALRGKDFKECVVHVFEGIDFLKPRGGTTTVSYSLRFTPGK